MDTERVSAGSGVGTEYGRGGRRTQRVRTIVVGSLIALLVVGGVSGYFLLNAPIHADARQDETVTQAEQAMRTFTKAWTTGDWKGAATLTNSPTEAESLLTSVGKNLQPTAFTIDVGNGVAERPDRSGGPVVVPFTVRMTVPKVGAFTYTSKARIVQTTGTPLVTFAPTMLHPQLKAGQTLAVAKMSTRGSILDRNGDVLAAPSLVGQVDEQTGKGVSGLQQRYDKQLGGSAPAYAVAITDRESGKALKPLRKAGGQVGRDVHTTIDAHVQSAAADALEQAVTPASLIAIQPSSGDVLAVANNPGGGFNRALVGQYPPGSTFKVVTAAALLEKGLQPSDPLQCPQFEWVNGYRFANQGEFTLPSGSTFRDAFAHSCNTAFVRSRDRLDDDSLSETAKAFGIGGVWDTGAGTFDGSVPVNTDVNDKAAAMIGQARDLASPLVMASVAATVKSGRFVQPRLVPEAIKHPFQAPRNLDPQVVSDLQSMMRSVVTDGSGDALRGLPGEPHAKTGTAEYGEEKPPRTHAWMIGYQQDADIAWAVLLENGGSGGSDAGPIAASFLKALGPK
ncbi:penicillin-binding transpeptidase domain-containing protein [Actinopolymorpha pittospori]|uniref:Cell division protein FtsI/penicillin-binding protein 2 n=1 Tax=Actinopolymorpha pittospori TaxID=648752 RepID=A0A927N116_9ACTN|nr:cell division protein FtsI/penicillin-binding protein 2 [Actinopolymorpha pittospori]